MLSRWPGWQKNLPTSFRYARLLNDSLDEADTTPFDDPKDGFMLVKLGAQNAKAIAIHAVAA